MKGLPAVLKILEQYFIKTLGTAGKGNELRENVNFAPGGSLTIVENGKPDIKLGGAGLTHTRSKVNPDAEIDLRAVPGRSRSGKRGTAREP